MMFGTNSLPQAEVSQLYYLLNLLTDPKASKAKLDALLAHTEQANQASAAADKAKTDADAKTAEVDKLMDQATAKMADADAMASKANKQRISAENSEANAKAALRAVDQANQALADREQTLTQREAEFEAARSKFKSLIS